MSYRVPLTWAQIPMLMPTISLSVGILLGWAGVTLVWALIPIAFAIGLIFADKCIAAVGLLFCVTGIIVVDSYLPKDHPALTNKSHYYSGEVVKSKPTDIGQKYIIAIDSIDHTPCKRFKILVQIPSFETGIGLTDRLHFRCKLDQLQNYVDLPDQPDVTKSLKQQGVSASTFLPLDSIDKIIPLTGLRAKLVRMNLQIERIILQSSMSNGAREFLATTLIGNSDIMDVDRRQLFAQVGLSHILALSGLHIGIITWVILILLWPMKFLKLHNTRYIVATVILWLYAIMTGLSTSVVRATIMATATVTAILLQKRLVGINTLLFAAFAILLFNPLSIFELGFQLSFMSVAGIVLLADKMNYIDPKQRKKHYLLTLLCVPIAATLGTCAVCAYYFHIFPVYFLLANSVVGLLLIPIIGGGLIMVLLGYFAIPTKWLEIVIDWIYRSLEWFTQWLNHLPGATISNLYIHPVTVWLCIGIFIVFAYWVHTNNKKVKWPICISILLSVVIENFCKEKYPEHEAYLLRDTNATTMLIKHQNDLLMYTTAKSPENENLRKQYQRKFTDYLGRRGIDSIRILPKHYSDGWLCANGNILKLGNLNIGFMNSDSCFKEAPTSNRIDYLIICKGSRKNVVKNTLVIAPDTVIFSRDIDARLERRFSTELTDKGIPCKSMRTTPFQMHL